MMDFIRTWLIGIVAAGIVAAAAHTLTPPGAVRRVVRLAGGLLVLLAVVRPLVLSQWQSPDLSGAEMERQAQQYAGQAKQAGESVMKKIIEEQTSAYIESEAKTRGLSLRAVVEVQTPPGQETPLPYRARLILRGKSGTQEKNSFADWVDNTLNIPLDRQRWEEGG